MEDTQLHAPPDAADSMERLMSLVEAVSTQLTDLAPTLRRLQQWETDGTLDHLDKVLHFVNAALDSMTPEIVSSLVQMVARGMETADASMHSKMVQMAPRVFESVEHALSAPAIHEKHELRHLLQLLKDPAVQDGLEIVFHVLRGFGTEHQERTSVNHRATV
ncbi:hypothetical protein JZ785_07375 [Alicyclobacillus curvatus]|jgi:uncharacterized protein YjgD (DUF1641 family)|nr:hypothetical protein JZ785_07375 [Alicyclobacillus curvatus]